MGGLPFTSSLYNRLLDIAKTAFQKEEAELKNLQKKQQQPKQK